MPRMRHILQAIPVPLVASSLVLALLGQPSWAVSPSWPHTWGGSSDDYGTGVTLDTSGNVYVSGYTSSFGAGGWDALILKYSPAGTLRWAKTWGGGGDEYAQRIAIGPDGYIYVAGNTTSFGAGSDDIFLLKLDSDGNLKWGVTWGGGSYESSYDLAFDQAGNIYVAGESYSNGNTVVILKFSPDGGPPIWTASWTGTATYEAGQALAVDSNSNVIIAGINWDYSGAYLHNSILLVKYDSAGNYLWSTNWVSAAPEQDEAVVVKTDSAGNIYVGGDHAHSCPNSNFSQCEFQAMVLKVDAGGNFQWAQTWGGSGFDRASGLGIDPNGHLLVSGGKNRNGATPALFVLSYDTVGGLLSSTGWGGQQTIASGISPRMAVNSSGDAWVVATAQNKGGKWSPILGGVKSLPNRLATTPYSLGTPTGQVTILTNPTVAQTGVGDTGGGGLDVFVARFPHYLSTGHP